MKKIRKEKGERQRIINSCLNTAILVLCDTWQRMLDSD